MKHCMKHAWKSFWRNYFKLNGRSTRSEFWFSILNNMLVLLFLILIMGIGRLINIFDIGFVNILFSIPCYAYTILIIIPSFAICIRRLHDIDKSGWWCFICILLVPFGLGVILLTIFMCLDSSLNPINPWGPNPKKRYYNKSINNNTNFPYNF